MLRRLSVFGAIEEELSQLGVGNLQQRSDGGPLDLESDGNLLSGGAVDLHPHGAGVGIG